MLAVHAALFIGTRPGYYFGEEEKPLSLERVDIGTAAKGAQRLSPAFSSAGVKFVFSAEHLS